MSSQAAESKSFSDNSSLQDTSLLYIYAAAVVSLITVIVICVCGCRKSAPKNELLGLAGKVKITNPDQALNEEDKINGRQRSCCGLDVDQVDSIALTEIQIRNHVEAVNHSSTVGVLTTATRSLPDLPVDTNRRISNSAEAWDKLGEQNSGGDTGSDLYATVEEHKLVANGRLNKKVSQSTNAMLERGQSGSYASPTTDDSVSPYACYKKENPYDKVNQAEHPYAQVTSANKKKKLGRDLQSSLDSSTSSSSTSRSDDPKQPSPIPIHRTRRPSWENSSESSSSHSNVVDNIPAAGAISGAVAASNDLPYMTPPIVQNEINAPHFSGDSQDSGKGYTSISVREPLSNIIRRPRIVDSSHYATVSDDSDEMYAAIEEPAQVYTSGSETYAKIAPIARPEQTSPPQLPSVSSLRSVNHASPQSSSNINLQLSNTSHISSKSNQSTSNPSIQRSNSPQVHPNQDLNSSLLHVNLPHVHSRQSSNSSAISSDYSNDKRRTNSPLPKTPEIIDDMYAKVIKQKKNKTNDSNWSSSSHDDNIERVASSNTPSPDFVFASTSHVGKQVDPYESLNGVGYEKVCEYGRSKKKKNSFNDDEDPNYEQIHKQHRRRSNTSENYDLGYERIHKQNRSSQDLEATYDMGYERIHKQQIAKNLESNYDIGYEQIPKKCHDCIDPESNYDNGYERIHKLSNNDDLESNYDLGYERIHKKNSLEESDPNYERIHKYSTHHKSDSAHYDAGYEQIHKIHRNEDTGSYDVGYEQIHRTNLKKQDNLEDSDPNYEELDDPNYEVLGTIRKDKLCTNEKNTENSYATIHKNEITDHNYASIHKHKNVEHNYASINKNNKKKFRHSEQDYASLVRKYDNNNESTYECMNDCFEPVKSDEASSEESMGNDAKHSRKETPVSRIEVEPNVFYSQVQKYRDKR